MRPTTKKSKKVDNMLFVSLDDSWQADDIVNDSSNASHPLGLVEIKNPHSARSQTLTEASVFRLEHNNLNDSIENTP